MIDVLPYHGTQPLEIAILVLFAILFGWVSAGFWTALAGFCAARDATRRLRDQPRSAAPAARADRPRRRAPRS